MVPRPHERGFHPVPPRPPHERMPPRLPEEEATHQEIFEAVLELREKLERVEEALRRMERR